MAGRQSVRAIGYLCPMFRSRDIQTAFCAPSERVVSPVVVAVLYVPVMIVCVGVITAQLVVVGTGLAIVGEMLRQCPKLLRGGVAEALDEWLLARSFVWRWVRRAPDRLPRLERWRKRVGWAIVPLDLFFVYAFAELWLHPVHVQAHQASAPEYLFWFLMFTLLAAPTGTLWIVGTSLEIRHLRCPPRCWYPSPLLRSREIAVRLESDGAWWVSVGLSILGACCLAVSASS